MRFGDSSAVKKILCDVRRIFYCPKNFQSRMLTMLWKMLKINLCNGTKI